jgi:hypothetical protein
MLFELIQHLGVVRVVDELVIGLIDGVTGER